MVRHGSTLTTGKILPGRKPGLFLSPKGEEEVQRTAKYIADKFPSALVYASPMERAHQTASIIAKALGQKTKKLAGLNECDFGSWTGRKLSSLRKLKSWQIIQNNPGSFRFPGGESFGELQSRMVEAIGTLEKRHTGKIIVAVSHADPIKVALGYFLGLPLDSFQKINVSPASISSFVLFKNSLLVNQTMILNVNMTIEKEKTNE